MSSEHYVVKDLPFYEEARAANTKARQDQLAKREKKRKEGTLRQSLGGSRPTSSSTTHPPSKKKFVTRPAKKALNLSLSSSSHSLTSEESGPSQDSIGLPSMKGRWNQEPEPMVPYINLEPEEEEAQMAPNLRVSFKERQRKRLSEALSTTPLPAKKSRSKVPREEPIPDVPMVQVPFYDIVRSCQELVVRPSTDDTCPMGDRGPTATLGGNAKEKDVSATPSRWEEIAALLRAVPCFTASEPPASGVDEFFLFSHHHFINLRGNPRIAGMVRPSHVTLESTPQCTYPLLKYTTEEMAKVVGFTPFCPSLPNFPTLIPILLLFQGVAAIHSLMQQRSSLRKWLEVAESMLVFLTRQIDNSEELHTQLVRVKNEMTDVRIVAANAEKMLKELQEEVQMAKVEARRMREKKEVVEAKCKDVEQERNQLKKELEGLRAMSEAQKKQLEELQVGFTIEKKTLTEDYQKQVDEIFLLVVQALFDRLTRPQVVHLPTFLWLFPAFS